MRSWLGPPRPVDEQAEERGGGGEGEEQRVAEIEETAGAERELEAFDGPSGNVELAVAIDGPVHGAEKNVPVADEREAGVGDEIAGAEDDDPAAANAERELVADTDAFGRDDHAEPVGRRHAGERVDVAGTAGARRTAEAITGLAPR